MKYLLSLSLLLLTMTTFTQNFVKWIGGTPGRETAWEEPRNWNTYRVPDHFSNVIIPDVSSSTRVYPRIKGGIIVELNSLLIYTNAQLCLEQEAQLLIYDHQFGLYSQHLDIQGIVVVRPESGVNKFVQLNAEMDTVSHSSPLRISNKH